MDNYSARALVQSAWARVRALQDELNEAKARELVPHPLLGKRVRRRHRSPYGRWMVQRGIMCQNASPRPLAAGRGRFRVYVAPAECYVRTASGIGAYNVREDADNEPWELDE